MYCKGGDTLNGFDYSEGDNSTKMIALREEVNRVIETHLPEQFRMTMGITELVMMSMYAEILSNAIEDLRAREKLDPAVDDDVDSADATIKTDSPFQAVLSYRISNCIYRCEQIDRNMGKKIAHQIYEKSKKNTTIDIHFSAQIGKRFVIDHGMHTVIGGTSEIGDDCTIRGEHHVPVIGNDFHVLQGVILGALDVDNNIKGKRHPTIGNNVTICGCTRIFGSVNIGDDVFISPCSVIVDDIPSHHKVIVINQLQLCKEKKTKCNTFDIKVYGVVPDENNTLIVYGSNLKNFNVKLVKNYTNLLSEIEVTKTCEHLNYIQLKFLAKNNQYLNYINEISLKLENEERHVYIINSLGLREILHNLGEGV